jgi:arylsulfatase A-like enzyme
MEDVKLMRSSGNLRGIKRDLYEGGIRVPTIIWGAGLPKGQLREEYGAFWDIVPTFLEIAGATTNPKDIDGISLWQHWISNEPLPLRPLYWEFYEDGFAQAVRYGDWKYIFLQPKNKPISIELYNLKEDIEEHNNVATTHPKELSRLQNFAKKNHQKAEIESFRREKE